MSAAFQHAFYYLGVMFRTLLLLFICGCFSFSASSQITYELIEEYSYDDIDDVLAEFGVPAGFLPIQYEVKYYKVTYPTTHPNGDEILVTGGLAVPETVCPVALASYQHGTVAAKTNVPSHLNDEALLGVLYAAVGIVCTQPDYIGLGDSDLFHLYVHADSEARTAMDMVLAAHELQEELGFNLNNNHVMYGYSQGGHATMALQKLWEEEYLDEYNLLGSAPMSGPYDMSGAQADVLVSDNPYPTPGYLPYVLLSFQEVYGTMWEDISDVFVEPYATMIPDLFDGINSMGYINNQLPDVPIDMLHPDVLEAFQNAEDHPIQLALEDNDLYDWAPSVPTELYYCQGDDQVSYLNSVNALEAFENNGSTSVTFFDGGDLDHSNCATGAMLSSFAFLYQEVGVVFDPEISVNVEDVTVFGAMDGSISVSGVGIENWTLEWSNGDSGTDIENLDAGTYTLTITNEVGCWVEFDYIVGTPVFVEGYDDIQLTLFPNPTSGILNVELSSGQKSFTIFDMLGDRVMEGSVSNGERLDLNSLSDGIYVFRLEDGTSIKILKR